jgi:hypothetical protein
MEHLKKFSAADLNEIGLRRIFTVIGLPAAPTYTKP